LKMFVIRTLNFRSICIRGYIVIELLLLDCRTSWRYCWCSLLWCVNK